MFAALEKPVAYATFAYAFAALVWKSPIGLDWIPVLGKSWDMIFTSDSEKKIPQYPRRHEDEDFWHLVYLLMYGVFGSIAQFCGIMISKRSITRPALVRYARIYGSFHMIIAIHHLIWSQNLNYGKLELWRFNLPGVYPATTVSAMILVYHAACMIGVNLKTANMQDICYRKAVMDTVTCCTFISFLAFLVGNMAGIETTFEAERLWWAVTMYPIPIILVWGILFRPSK